MCTYALLFQFSCQFKLIVYLCSTDVGIDISFTLRFYICSTKYPLSLHDAIRIKSRDAGVQDRMLEERDARLRGFLAFCLGVKEDGNRRGQG